VSMRLKNTITQVIDSQNLTAEKSTLNTLAGELGISILDCAAALLYLHQRTPADTNEQAEITLPPSEPKISPFIKMVRYRLNVGLKQQITLDTLKQVLVDESGVDVNNIKNISMREHYTLLELPDAMPPDIFQHLKTVAINQHELDIKRLKARHKKRGGYRHRRAGINASPGAEKIS